MGSPRGLVPEGHNPAKGIQKFKEQGRERYLTSEEFSRLGAALADAETIGLPWDADDTSSPEAFGAERDEYDALPFLRFDPTAQGVFAEWRAGLESRIRSGQLSPALESHLAKYRKLVPALALLNHLADGGTGPVVEAATLRALALSEYLEAHARRAYAAGSEAETRTATAILARIRKGDLMDGFTLRDAMRAHWANLTDRDQVKSGLDLLCDLDWLAAKTEQTGGRPRTSYSINPGALA